MTVSRCFWGLLLLTGCQQPTRNEPPPVPSGLAEFVLTAVPGEFAHPLRINYDNHLELLGYELAPEGALRPGMRVTLTLFWQCARPLEPGWSLFTQLLDASGRPIGVPGLDQAGPLRQALSTSGWERGKVYVDRQEFELPGSVDTPEVTIVTGVGREITAPPASSAETAPKTTVDYRLPVVSGPSAGRERGLVTRVVVAGTRLGAPAPSASRNPIPDLPALLRAFR
jgi:hypothetical protein